MARIRCLQTSKAYTKAEKKVSRTHQVELTEILRVENNMNKVNKLIDLNKNLTKDIYDTFTTIEAAVDKSDIELLQALSLDEDKLNIAKKHL
jgi:predicted nucleotidyltransferase component of viral defense system